MDDLLGFDRFERHREWLCSGRVDGEVDDIEPRTFTVGQGDRWLLTTGDGTLIAIGDQARDLVADRGGLVREPATHGFMAYTSANLARQIGVMTRQNISGWEVVGEPRDSKHAGRRAVDVELLQSEYQISLGIDADAGTAGRRR